MTRLVSEGELRTRAILETPVDTVDESGALVRVWQSVASVWASVSPKRGAEFFVAGEQESVLTSEVVVRWRPEVASPMRFRIGARALLIRTAFDPDGRRRFLVCTCEEFSA
ncbi:MAG TPA: phage head closure protein [Beijerinckiaceae bacterium]|nr:phage head closure protein [Beijerinckiaceae bacterium]